MNSLQGMHWSRTILVSVISDMLVGRANLQDSSSAAFLFLGPVLKPTSLWLRKRSGKDPYKQCCLNNISCLVKYEIGTKLTYLYTHSGEKDNVIDLINII